MVVVVVVVNAMSEKGEQLGVVDSVLQRNEGSYNENNVYNQLLLSEAGVECNQDIVAVISELDNARANKIAEYDATVYNDEKKFTLKTDVIEQHDLLPGDKVRVEVFEAVEEQEDNNLKDYVDDSDVVDRVSVKADKTKPDGVNPRLSSKRVYEWLGDSPKRVKFKNTRNGKETIAKISRNKNRTHFSFPKQARRSIDAQVNDLIEVIDATEDGGGTGADINEAELIKEMHEMVTEMYDAYVESSDD